LPDNEINQIIRTLEDICESKENISNQLKRFVTQHKFYEEHILTQNEEIKLLKREIQRQSEKFHIQYDQIDSKLNLMLQSIGKNDDSTSSEITLFKEKMRENCEIPSNNTQEETRN
jgi:hypothetical protein